MSLQSMYLIILELCSKNKNQSQEVSSEIFEQLRFEVSQGDIHPQDGIDTINKIIKDLLGKSDQGIEHILESFRRRLGNIK